MRIDNGRADHRRAAHRGAGKMKMNRVAPEHAALAEMRKPRVADAALAVAVKHRVPAHAVGVGALDDDVARQICHLAAEFPRAEMLRAQWPVKRQHAPVDGLDNALFRADLTVFFRCGDNH